MNIKKLISKTNKIKLDTFKMLNSKGGGHYGGSFSCAEILVNIYFNQLKKKDKFILSKAHAGVILYAILAEKKKISKKLLSTYGKENSILGVHGEHDLLKNIDFSCGSLGHGLSYAAGVCYANKKNKVYTLIGDGESQEGSIWEAALFASQHKLSNLIVILDYNKKQSSGLIKDILNLDPIVPKWKSFGWHVIRCNGHNHNSLNKSFKKINKNKPNIIVADTIKGKGLSFLEKRKHCHYDRLNNEQKIKGLEELNIK